MKRNGISILALALVFAFIGGTRIEAQIKSTGRAYTLDKPTDFKYDLFNREGTDYIWIQGTNLPQGFKKPITDDNGNRVIVDTVIVKIPEKIEGYPVGFVGQIAANEYDGSVKCVTSVTMPDSVIGILEYAFAGSSISSIKLPKNLIFLGGNAFSGCTNLRGSITIPQGVTAIQYNTFNKTAITEVIIPESVTIIGDWAFRDCKELTSVKLPSKPIQYLTFDGDKNDYVAGQNYAFSGCTKLSLATRKAIQDSGYKDSF